MCLLCQASLPLVSHQVFATSELFHLHLEQEHRITSNHLPDLSLQQGHQPDQTKPDPSTRLRPHPGQRRKEETLLLETEYWPKACTSLPPNSALSWSSPPYCLADGEDFSLVEGFNSQDHGDQEEVLQVEELKVVKVMEGSKTSHGEDGMVRSKVPVVRMAILLLMFLVLLLGCDFWWPKGFLKCCIVYFGYKMGLKVS